MSKRLSRYRRLAKLAADSVRAARVEKSLAHGAEMALLQQGNVRSHSRENETSATFRAPNWTSEDRPSRKGKIVNKKFKANFGQKGRFTPT